MSEAVSIFGGVIKETGQRVRVAVFHELGREPNHVTVTLADKPTAKMRACQI